MLMIVWVVLMILWLFYGSYSNWDPANPRGIGNTLIPWICVLILGIVMFWYPVHPVPLR